MLEHLQPVDQGGAAPNRRRHMHRLGHLLEVSPLLEALRRVGIDAVRTLDRVRHGKRYQRLLTHRQRPIREDRAVVVKELSGELVIALGDIAEVGQMLRFVVAIHESSSRIRS